MLSWQVINNKLSIRQWTKQFGELERGQRTLWMPWAKTCFYFFSSSINIFGDKEHINTSWNGAILGTVVNTDNDLETTSCNLKRLQIWTQIKMRLNWEKVNQYIWAEIESASSSSWEIWWEIWSQWVAKSKEIYNIIFEQKKSTWRELRKRGNLQKQRRKWNRKQ